MKNPESMRYTELSRHPLVVNANSIVLFELQKVKYEATKANNRGLLVNVEKFRTADFGQHESK